MLWWRVNKNWKQKFTSPFFGSRKKWTGNSAGQATAPYRLLAGEELPQTFRNVLEAGGKGENRISYHCHFCWFLCSQGGQGVMTQPCHDSTFMTKIQMEGDVREGYGRENSPSLPSLFYWWPGESSSSFTYTETMAWVLAAHTHTIDLSQKFNYCFIKQLQLRHSWWQCK